jgi:hypothetical protein
MGTQEILEKRDVRERKEIKKCYLFVRGSKTELARKFARALVTNSNKRGIKGNTESFSP